MLVGGGGADVFVGSTTGTGVLVGVAGGKVFVGAGVLVGFGVACSGVSDGSLVGGGVNVAGTFSAGGGSSAI